MLPAELLNTLGRGILVATLQASLLIGAILLVRAIVQDRWSARWQASLWLLLILCMVLPWRPQTRPDLSLRIPDPVQSLLNREGPEALPSPLSGPLMEKAAGPPRLIPAPRPSPLLRPWQVLVLVWLVGILALTLRLVQSNVRLWLAVRRGRVLTSEPALELLEACKREMGVATLLGVVITDQVPGPALFGFIRPRLLLPPSILEQLAPEEFRHVLRHELAHLKRLDIHWGWLCAWLQILHWFNPMVWLAFHQMRGDRELACDEEAVATLPPRETASYGSTLIKLLEAPASLRALPSLAGISENATHFTRRIRMIARLTHTQKRPNGRWTWLSALVFTGLASFALAVKVQAGDPPVLGQPIIDKIDYPFVNDPGLPGGWRTVDLVKEPSDFKPDQRQWTRDLYFKELFVKPGGRTNWAWTWTKGLFLHAGDRTASRYDIQTLAGKTYLFFEWKSGDYVYRHQKPWFYVLEKDDRLVVPETRVVDKIDYPFVDDPAFHGTWLSVDFVEAPDRFKPGKPQFPGEPFLKQMDILDGGRLRLGFRGGRTGEGSTWTRGLILDPQDKTASRYQIQDIGGKTYLFFEWKSGDYTLRAMKPKYYVLEQAP